MRCDRRLSAEACVTVAISLRLRSPTTPPTPTRRWPVQTPSSEPKLFTVHASGLLYASQPRDPALVDRSQSVFGTTFCDRRSYTKGHPASRCLPACSSASSAAGLPLYTVISDNLPLSPTLLLFFRRGHCSYSSTQRYPRIAAATWLCFCHSFPWKEHLHFRTRSIDEADAKMFARRPGLSPTSFLLMYLFHSYPTSVVHYSQFNRQYIF